MFPTSSASASVVFLTSCIFFPLPIVFGFSIPPPSLVSSRSHVSSRLYSDSEWAKELEKAGGFTEDLTRGSFEREMKMKGLFDRSSDPNDPAVRKRSANAALLSWLEEEGEVYLSELSDWATAPHPLAVSTETVDETTNESTGRGLLARRRVNEGDELLTIPMRMCMTIGAARRVFGGEIVPEGMNEYLAIALLMIRENFVLKNTKSEWAAYMGVLPAVKEVNPTFTWTDEDLTFLEGSPVVAATKSMQAKLRREYDTLLGDQNTGLIHRYPNMFPEEHYTFDNWIWAFTMLFSRAIRLRNLKEGEALAMVPYADLINHSPFSGAYVDGRESGSWLFKDGQEEVILYADRGYRKMEQVYISYGPKSNADLLLLYGFALERNPFNSVDVTVSIATTLNDLLLVEKREYLKKVGREQTVDFPCYADRYPTEMLEYLRLMQMTPEDTRGKPLAAFDYTRTISAANEQAVLASIIEAVRNQLSLYPTTEEQDAALIQDKSLFQCFNYNQRMAVRHRRNEKRLLKRTVAALEKQLKNRGLDVNDLERAGGNTAGKVLEGDERRFGIKQRTALEERLEA
eukprot:CAMPEP_0113312620 /NCGR_PEP_ID=MMETSP0010_2-20120614/9385_1 /TAXON_ID=216773 ORGANISM="Corethron hystrix, Strain 308" /NCGR_SAMPLE_ID=MMETSP0010_2 /ASSEMBLY_ACC=CAM_ASM_000155 /LENGTH=572 /DNA_ID=CAMNT_0000168497 /DNA_START=73 /DNA_END=1788 /DNA_ORIENTATION=- /assembly_acc=CAM_ASM_000155